MIIDNTYFKNDIYVPKAKPSIVNDLSALSTDLVSFINEKEAECLIRCLGLPLYLLLLEEIDVSAATKLKPTADPKWNDLLNGVQSYTDPSGNEVNWRGIRYRSSMMQTGQYDKSFIAYYVYWFYEEDEDTTEYIGGHQKNDAKNAETVSSRPKVVKAWNNFVDLVQGKSDSKTIYFKNIGLGVDYYGNNSNEQTSLYKFITDYNELYGDIYPNFKPEKFLRKNNFDI